MTAKQNSIGWRYIRNSLVIVLAGYFIYSFAGILFTMIFQMLGNNAVTQFISNFPLSNGMSTYIYGALAAILVTRAGTKALMNTVDASKWSPVILAVVLAAGHVYAMINNMPNVTSKTDFIIMYVCYIIFDLILVFTKKKATA